MSTFQGLEVGKRGISTAQTQLNTTGHNMTNAATPGYSRQNVQSSATSPNRVFTSQSPNGQLGSGVLTDAIVRLRDQFLDTKFWGQASNASDLSVQADALGELEKLAQGTEDGNLQQAMQDVWKAWETVQTNPNDEAAKAVLNERMTTFTTTAQNLNRDIAGITSRLETQQTMERNQANELLTAIAGLNDVIYRSGGRDNDAMDQRDSLIDQLSGLAGIQVTATEKGMVSIRLQDGTSLVAGRTVESALTDQSNVTSGSLSGIKKALGAVEDFQSKLQSVTTNFEQEPSSIDTHLASWQKLVGELGTKAEGINRATETAILAKNGTERDRQSVMGVSLDEEMSNLIKYQHAYNAAARLVSTTDELLDTIINRMGV